MKFYKEKEVVCVETVKGGIYTRHWHESRLWRKDIIHKETYEKQPYVVVTFFDGTAEVLWVETNEEAEALALKIKEKYNLINLEQL